MDASIDFSGVLRGSIADGGGGGGDEIIITPVVTSGTKIADVSVNGVEKDLYCPTPPTPPDIDITPVVTSGTKIADVSVGGVEKDLYTPDYGADIAALDGRLDIAEDNITSLTGRVGTAEGNITNLAGHMTEAETDITEIKQSLSDLIPLEKTASGAIVTFDDGNDLPMPKLEVAIEPQQDLHGYDAPWVGGAGKNKFTLNISEIKNLNTTGTWVDETYTINGAEYKINRDNAGNITSINARSVAKKPNGDLKISAILQANSYILSSGFSETNGINDTFLQKNGVTIARGNNSSPGSNFTLEEASEVILHIRLSRNDSSFVCYPMIRLSTETNATFAPYSNICPISGWDVVNVTVADDVETPTVSNVYTIDLDGTRYGGELDVVSGLLTITDGYIASYNSEALPSTWISDRDVYAEGTTPTVGAEVVYKLATPQSAQLTPTQVTSLLGVNNIYADTGDLELTYFVNNSLVQAIYDMLNIFRRG